MARLSRSERPCYWETYKPFQGAEGRNYPELKANEAYQRLMSQTA